MFDLTGESDEKNNEPSVDKLREIVVSSAKETAFKKVFLSLKLLVKSRHLWFIFNWSVYYHLLKESLKKLAPIYFF